MHRQPATLSFFFLSLISNSCSTFASPVRKDDRSDDVRSLHLDDSDTVQFASRTQDFFGIDHWQPLGDLRLDIVDEFVYDVVRADRYPFSRSLFLQSLRHAHVEVIYDGCCEKFHAEMREITVVGYAILCVSVLPSNASAICRSVSVTGPTP